MIPNNISRKNVLDAIAYIDREGIPPNRQSRQYHLHFGEKYYPPKYVVSIANRYANHHELFSEDFSGGVETNTFLQKLGFTISDGYEHQPGGIQVVTVILEQKSISCIPNGKRLELLKNVIAKNPQADVLVFPAGMFDFSDYDEAKIGRVLDEISDDLRQNKSKAMVCVGVDCSDGIDQLAYAVSSEGIAAAARKFYPTQGEDGEINCAAGAFELERGFPRFFTVKERTMYLAVCYDCFGIRHKHILNAGMHCIISLIHGFNPHGESNCGDVDFARKGLVGASAYWQVPVFASTVFRRRALPARWPSAVLWKSKNLDVRHFCYQDNLIQVQSEFRIETRKENCTCRTFTF